MASSFDGTNIRIEVDGNSGAAPAWQRQSYVTTRHIPGGNTDVTQALGYGSKTIALSLWLTDAEWTALEPKLLTTGTLIMAGTSYSNVLLETLGAPQDLVNGYVSVQATFRQTGA